MRADGRKRDEIRNISIEVDYVKHAHGSCLFSTGDTKVICTASVDDGVPPFLKGKGTGWITSEYSMLPMSCQTRVPRESSKGKKTGRTHEVQRLIGRALRSIVDMSALGERTVWLDCDVIQADGGTRCASISGSFIALYLAMERLSDAGKINRIPVKDQIAAVSVGILDGEAYLDLTYDEDSRADVDTNIVMTGNGRFVEVQCTAEREPFTAAQFGDILGFAEKGIKKVFKEQKKALRGSF
ncbi:MAG: ribonuclease PH [Candidatus Omnitrophica bacterium]|nr:ribonuclease PH [Candidatus Omnitrophota bacterium]MDD5488935.1 ribonuclease PH [Candidatus Omnitrophota bacterium]